MSRMALLVDGTRAAEGRNLNNTFISYYTYGAALGLGLDLGIRAHTHGARSLDDLMRRMWRDFGRTPPSRPGVVDSPYTIEDLTARLAAVLEDQALAQRWIAQYVEGRDVMDYDALVAPAGLRVRKRNPGAASLGLASFRQGSGALRLDAPPPPGSPLASARLGVDDQVLAVNGRAVADYASLEAAMRRVRPGGGVSLRVHRRGAAGPDTVAVRAIEDPRVEIAAIESIGGTLTDAQQQFRQAWLGSKR
jgi:predicted metalloprotease with PDZ domain